MEECSWSRTKRDWRTNGNMNGPGKGHTGELVLISVLVTVHCPTEWSHHTRELLRSLLYIYIYIFFEIMLDVDPFYF